MIHTQHRYQVMDGEPHLGTILEQQWVYDRDDIIEALVAHFEEDSVDSIDDIVYLDRDMEHSFTLDELIDLTDLDYINEGLQHFLDDEWGTDKLTTYLMAWFEENLYKGETMEFGD